MITTLPDHEASSIFQKTFQFTIFHTKVLILILKNKSLEKMGPVEETVTGGFGQVGGCDGSGGRFRS